MGASVTKIGDLQVLAGRVARLPLALSSIVRWVDRVVNRGNHRFTTRHGRSRWARCDVWHGTVRVLSVP